MHAARPAQQRTAATNSSSVITRAADHCVVRCSGSRQSVRPTHRHCFRVLRWVWAGRRHHEGCRAWVVRTARSLLLVAARDLSTTPLAVRQTHRSRNLFSRICLYKSVNEPFPLHRHTRTHAPFDCVCQMHAPLGSVGWCCQKRRTDSVPPSPPGSTYPAQHTQANSFWK
jgi:hypothetical protein